jgi:8-oxo-dGTP diphosphatase
MTEDQRPKRTTLCFVFDREANRLLMIHKKRGQGAGKWNVPGGKIQAGEDPVAAAIRETVEETGIQPVAPREVGTLEFYFPAGNSWDNICTVYSTENFTGALIPESEECRAQWVDAGQLPLDQMWDSDRHWLPLLISGKPFHRVYHFDQQDRLIEERVIR